MKTLQLALAAPFIAISLLLATTSSQADTLPDYYPKSFAILGILGGIDTRSQTISINDSDHRYDTNVKVHTKNSQFSSMDILTPGMNLGASITSGTTPRIMEIWVLPKNYRPIAPPSFR